MTFSEMKRVSKKLRSYVLAYSSVLEALTVKLGDPSYSTPPKDHLISSVPSLYQHIVVCSACARCCLSSVKCSRSSQFCNSQ